MARVYVAGIWKNEAQPYLVVALRQAGHIVYDYKNPLFRQPGLELPPKYDRLSVLQIILFKRRDDCDACARLWADVCVVAPPLGVKSIPSEVKQFEALDVPIVYHLWPRERVPDKTRTDSLPELLALLRS